MSKLAIVGLVCGVFCSTTVAHADPPPNGVIELRYTPTARAQVALWIEDSAGKFLATVQLTESVAYRGIGNRPGASQMNSGYRWPYGRREGVLPIWGSRRAAAPGARQFKRVIFQNRVEGKASQTAQDQSTDNYFCLSFATEKSSRDALDAVSCASVFNSDKGRYLTAKDVANHYVEPYEGVLAPHTGIEQPLPLTSFYPPRMDAMPCSAPCNDTADMAHFAADARAVMPEIDAVTQATPPGDSPQSVLFTIPSNWPAGDYVAWLEVNLEGDYAPHWDDKAYPSPATPDADWDYWAKTFGYAYRGQPSLAYKVPFTLGDTGKQTYSTDVPAGSASWDVFAKNYGSLQSLTDIVDDPKNAPGSGADRLRRNSDGHRLVVTTDVQTMLPDHVPDAGVMMDPTTGGDAGSSSGVAGADAGAAGHPAGGISGGVAGRGGSTSAGSGAAGSGMVIEGTGSQDGAVGAVYDLELSNHKNPLRSHTWVSLRFRAVQSQLALHAYEVRYGIDPIVDEASFLRNGRQAKNATDDAEGATLLMLPTDTAPGDWISGEIGDLVQQTHYYVAVRAVDKLNRVGPISVAEVSTTERHFATVSPCFVATAAYGSPLAAEIGVLRRVRDRFLMSNAPGRALVRAYYAVGPTLAAAIAPHDSARALVRSCLAPLVAAARWLH